MSARWTEEEFAAWKARQQVDRGAGPAETRAWEPREIGTERPRAKRLDGYASALEARYALVLDEEKRNGTIKAWWYEPLKLRLAYKCFYTPDFLVELPYAGLQFHETKGFMREDAIIKLKVAAKMYQCFSFTMVQWVKGEWIHKAISS